MCVSEIRVKRIRVNQGLGVIVKFQITRSVFDRLMKKHLLGPSFKIGLE